MEGGSPGRRCVPRELEKSTGVGPPRPGMEIFQVLSLAPANVKDLTP